MQHAHEPSDDVAAHDAEGLEHGFLQSEELKAVRRIQEGESAGLDRLPQQVEGLADEARNLRPSLRNEDRLADTMRVDHSRVLPCWVEQRKHRLGAGMFIGRWDLGHDLATSGANFPGMRPAKLPGELGLAHVTVEVHQCPGEFAAVH